MTKPRRLVLLAVSAALLVSAAGCGGGDAESTSTMSDTTAAASADAVTIKTFMYEPDPVEVAVGTTVTFTNEDDILHTVTSGTREKPLKAFDEQLDGPATTAEVTFDEPGTIDYFCSLHDGMDGQVVVN